MEISCIQQVPELLDAVKALWRRNSSTLGAFPAGAFEEHAAKGQILIAKANGNCLGGGPKTYRMLQHVKIIGSAVIYRMIG
ncbi:MAG: hypothetical protein LGR52_11625, partial [Candidatus Thiosymbion ectosymbiont of Robbea hypermnestra]|nr:hypothetical protein [Candidatus Thiosymbion ectosymbiont of Robbea hypermnestra]